jgi:hypothetical protein
MAGVTVAAIFLAIYTQQENRPLMRGLAGAGMIIAFFHPVLPFLVTVVLDIFREYVWSHPRKEDQNRSPFE